MKRASFLLAILLLARSTAAAAQEDPCAFDGDLDSYLEDLTARLSGQAPIELPKEATELALASRANSDGLSGGRLDLLRRAFVALDLGAVEEEEGKLVFNFNPAMLKLNSLGHFSPRVIVHEPVLFAAVGEHIDADDTVPEVERTARKEALTKGLQDFDDTELHVRWTNEGDTPEAGVELANRTFTEVYATAGRAVAQDIANEAAAFNAALSDLLKTDDAGAVSIETICGEDAGEALLKELTASLELQVPKLIDDLREQLSASAFFDIADLIDGQPRWTAESSYRLREGAAGPSEWSLNARFDIGPISINGFEKWAREYKKQGDSQGLREYLEESKLRHFLPNFSLTAKYTKTSDFEIAIPGADPFTQPDAHALSSTLNAGCYFGGGRDRRLELEATYDDVSDDPNRQDRFVSTLSWVETLDAELAKLAGGSELVVSFIWANKPEFRGEVDEDFGLRAGLKWSLGPKPGAGN